MVLPYIPPSLTVTISDPSSRAHDPLLLIAPDGMDQTSKSDVDSVCVPTRLLMVRADPGTKSQLACSVAVMLFLADANGLLCPMDLVENVGTKTNSGAVPPSTPRMDTVAEVIALGVTGESYLVAFTVADTVTEGELCPSLLFCSSKVTMQVVLLERPLSATVMTSSPMPWVHVPTSLNTAGTDRIGKVVELCVRDPVRFRIVTKEPGGMSQLVTSVTVSVLEPEASGLLWPIALVTKVGTMICIADAPLGTPNAASDRVTAYDAATGELISPASTDAETSVGGGS